MYVTTFHLSFKVPEELENHEFLQQNGEVDEQTIIDFLAKCFSDSEMSKWLTIGATSISSATMEEIQKQAQEHDIPQDQVIHNEMGDCLIYQIRKIVQKMMAGTAEQLAEQEEQ